MTRWKVWLYIIAAVVLVSACGWPAGGRTAAEQERFPVTVADGQSLSWDYTDVSQTPGIPGAQLAVVAKEMDLGYWKAVKEGAEQAVDDLNAYYGYEDEDRIELTFEGSGDGADVEAQVTQIDAVLAENPSAICIAAVDMASCTPQLEAAADNGIPVIALDSGVESTIPAGSCATDNYTAAMEAAGKLCGAIGDVGKIALVTHTSTSKTAIDRADGFIRELESHPDIFIAANLVQNEYESIGTMIESTLTLHPDLKGIFCTNERTADEVLEAVEKLERTDLAIIGFDAGKVQREAVEEGREYGLICQNPRGMGYISVMMALHAANGDPVDRYVDTGHRWIDRDGLADAANSVFLYD